MPKAPDSHYKFYIITKKENLNMKKYLSLTFAAIMLVLSLTACGGSSSKEVTASASDRSEEHTSELQSQR